MLSLSTSFCAAAFDYNGKEVRFSGRRLIVCSSALHSCSDLRQELELERDVWGFQALPLLRDVDVSELRLTRRQNYS